MADISADSLLPGGEFKATSCSGTLSIASGTSGVLATLTSTGGRKIRLTSLYLLAGVTEAGITVSCDGVAVISGLTLSSSKNTAGAFNIGTDISGSSCAIRHVEAFNTINITKASGSTANIIYYSTEQGF